jgi:methionyl-tRNA synthetase
MDKKNIFIGVAWPYVNGDLHIGHLPGYLLPADITARFHRFIGNKVLMVSGSDCHGTPITVEAEEKDITPQQVVDLYHPKHLKLFEQFGISFDLYTKTTTENHKQVVQEMFVNLAENGYINTDTSKQYYSKEEKRFLPDRYVIGICPHCGYEDARSDQCDACGRVLDPGELKNAKSKITQKQVSLKETEHYYIDLPELENFLKDYFKKHKDNWRNWIAQETKGWLTRGLKKRAITRDLDWGIEIPVDKLPKELQIDKADQKRIYVWFEAVIGYLSASIEWAKGSGKWKEWWYQQENTDHYYFMGQDNLVFHTIFWPGQLYGAYGKNIHLPDYPVINHFLNLEGHPFSKSRGITIDSSYLGEEYGVDPIRFYLTTITPENSTASFSWEHFVETHNNVLIGTVGNFINRVLNLGEGIEKFASQDIDPKVEKKLNKYLSKAYQHLQKCEFKLYVQTLIKIAEYGNKYLNEKSPWQLEENNQEYQQILTNTLLIVLSLQTTFKPLIPSTYEKLADLINSQIEKWHDQNQIKYLKQQLKHVDISQAKPLFSQIDPEIIKKEKAKLNLSDKKEIQNKIIIGRIVKGWEHPNADNLNIYQIDVGDKKLEIVCGDTSLEPNQIVPVALPGAEIQGQKINTTKIRGETSQGMLCSEYELNQGDDKEFILVLPDNLADHLGEPLEKHL